MLCCQIACKDEHVANDWTPYAKPQPDTGQFWIGITELVRGQVPKVKVTYIPKMCHHCDDAPCMADCKPEAIYKRDDGLVIIDPEKCTGCKLCKDACPHDAIFFNEHLNIAQKCTGCAHLLDNDEEWEVPRCVDQCPTDALRPAPWRGGRFRGLHQQSRADQSGGWNQVACLLPASAQKVRGRFFADPKRVGSSA